MVKVKLCKIQVSLDGRDVKTLNLRWLRSQIGIVSQEPILFATTIADNIRYGREGVTQAEIEQAAREANAHSFVSKLPEVRIMPVSQCRRCMLMLRHAKQT